MSVRCPWDFFCPGQTVSALSASLCMTDTPSPQSCEWTFTRLDPICLCLSYWGAQHWTQYSKCVSAVLSRGEGSPPWPGNALLDTAQEAVSLLCCKGALLRHGQLGVHQDPLVLSYRATCQPVTPILSSCLGLWFLFVELYEALVSPFLQIFLRSLWMSLYPSIISVTPCSFVPSANLLRVHAVPSFGSLTKMLNHTGLGHTTIVSQLDFVLLTTTIWV